MIAHTSQFPAPKMLLSTRLGLVSVPETDASSSPSSTLEPGFPRDEARDLIQALGRNLGMQMLTPRVEVFPEEGPSGEAGVSFPDEAIRKTLEGLDVVWLSQEEVVAAFVLETGAGAWEGLRRLADLLALQPKSKAALFAVSLPELQAGLLAEIHRPVYRMLKKPLAEAVRLLDWPRLQTEVEQLGERVRYLKPEFLEGISEVPELSPAG
jgi:hypothetical protein